LGVKLGWFFPAYLKQSYAWFGLVLWRSQLAKMTNEDSPDVAAKRLLTAIADVNRLLRDHAVELTRSARPAKAVTSLEPMAYRNGPVLEGYVDATLANGETVCWSLEVRWNQDAWTIEARLDRGSGERRETVAEVPSETVTSLDEFLSTLGRVTVQLLALREPEHSSAQVDSNL
jgi:hypothetical protein